MRYTALKLVKFSKSSFQEVVTDIRQMDISATRRTGVLKSNQCTEIENNTNQNIKKYQKKATPRGATVSRYFCYRCNWS